MSVPLIIHPDEFGFDDYNNLISVCYQISGAPGQIANLVSSTCISINARYVILDNNPVETTFGSVGIRTVDDNGNCNDIQVNRDCSIHYNRLVVSTNFTSGNISIIVYSNSFQVTLPNCGKEIVMKFQCLTIDNTPAINLTITRNYFDNDDTHGLIGKQLLRACVFIYIHTVFFTCRAVLECRYFFRGLHWRSNRTSSRLWSIHPDSQSSSDREQPQVCGSAHPKAVEQGPRPVCVCRQLTRRVDQYWTNCSTGRLCHSGRVSWLSCGTYVFSVLRFLEVSRESLPLNSEQLTQTTNIFLLPLYSSAEYTLYIDVIIWVDPNAAALPCARRIGDHASACAL